MNDKIWVIGGGTRNGSEIGQTAIYDTVAASWHVPKLK